MATPTITHMQTASGSPTVNVIEQGNEQTKHCVMQVAMTDTTTTSGGVITKPGGWYTQTSSFATGFEGAVCIWATRERDITNFGSFGNSTFRISHSGTTDARRATVYFIIENADYFPYPNTGTVTPTNTVTKTATFTNTSTRACLTAHHAAGFGSFYSSSTAWGSTPPANVIKIENLSSSFDMAYFTWDDTSASTNNSSHTMTSARDQHACAIGFDFLNTTLRPDVNGVNLYNTANGVVDLSKFNGITE